MKRSTREEWATRVARWQESGLSAAAFAAQIGVRAKTLMWWRTNLRRLARSGPPKSALANPRSARNGSPPVKSLEFVEVAAAPLESEPIEIVLSASVRVRVRRGFDSQTLERLLGVLEARR